MSLGSVGKMKQFSLFRPGRPALGVTLYGALLVG